jgi:hypothetical protein
LSPGGDYVTGRKLEKPDNWLNQKGLKKPIHIQIRWSLVVVKIKSKTQKIQSNKRTTQIKTEQQRRQKLQIHQDYRILQKTMVTKCWKAFKAARTT